MGISWVLLIAAAVIYIQNLCFRLWGFFGLRYVRQFNVQHCFEGDEIEMVETIVNRKLLPLPWLRLESLIPGGLRFEHQSNLGISSGQLFQNHRSLFSLMPYTKIVRRHSVVCSKRGSYRLDTATLSIGDILGVQAGTRSQKLDLHLLVYPKLVQWNDIPLPAHSWQGDIFVKRWIMQDPFAASGVREYQYGDSLGSIHWKATARSQKLQVHNREFTADPRLMIILNTQITETMWEAVSDPELVELGITYAASLAQHAISQGIPVGFCSNAYSEDAPKVPIHIHAEGGWDQLNLLYETMAKLVISCCRSIDDFLEMERHQTEAAMDYILITPFISRRVEEQIELMRLNGHAVEIIELQHEPIANDRVSEENRVNENKSKHESGVTNHGGHAS
ncbi:hypothetical protein D3C73_464410 [compost metagenome]